MLPIRAWPLDYFCRLAGDLVDSGYVVGVIGLKEDGKRAGAIQSRCGTVRCVDLTGCLYGCAGDSGCQADCLLGDGLYVAASNFEWWFDCMHTECGFQTLPSLDDPCLAEAAAGLCADAHNICF